MHSVVPLAIMTLFEGLWTEGEMRMNVRVSVLMLGVVLGLLSGCSDGGGASTASDNILKIGNGAEVQNLDPHLVSGVTEHRVLTTLFEGLVDLDPATLEPIPAVATAWTISEDGLTYTFTLRPEAKWSDGTALTARDFVYSWKRMLSPHLAAEYAYLLHCLKNAKAFNLGEITDFSQVGVKALDDLTLEVTLESPTPYFLSMQIHFAWFPVQQATIEAHGAMDERDTKWVRVGNHVGNGPYVLSEWSPNEVLRVTPNPHYWNKGIIKLDGIDFYPIDNQQTEERMFRAGELHKTGDIAIHKIDVYKKNNPELLHIHPYCGVYFYRLNVTKAPFDNPKVRRAFSMALNRDELTENVLKGGEPSAFNLTPPDTAGYTSNSAVPYDVEAAKKLLADAGYPNGEGLPPIEILYNTSENHKRIAETVQRMWKETLNADVRLLNQDWKVYLASMNNLDYHVVRSAWIADVLDPANFLECFLSGSGNNRTGWNSPEYDSLIGQAYQQADTTKRHALFQQAEALLLDESPIIPVYFYTWKFLMDPSVKGFTTNPLGYIKWTDLYLE